MNFKKPSDKWPRLIMFIISLSLLLHSSGRLFVSHFSYNPTYSCGLAAVRPHIEIFGKIKINKPNSNKYGYINRDGQLVIPYQFDYASEFHYPIGTQEAPKFKDGYSIVEMNNKWCAINTKGEFLIPCKFDSLSYMEEGLIAARINEKWGFLDQDGKVVIPYQFAELPLDHALRFCEGLAMVRKETTKWGFIDKTGQVVIDYQFDNNHDVCFRNGKAKVKKNGKWIYIDKKGQTLSL